MCVRARWFEIVMNDVRAATADLARALAAIREEEAAADEEGLYSV